MPHNRRRVIARFDAAERPNPQDPLRYLIDIFTTILGALSSTIGRALLFPLQAELASGYGALSVLVYTGPSWSYHAVAFGALSKGR